MHNLYLVFKDYEAIFKNVETFKRVFFPSYVMKDLSAETIKRQNKKGKGTQSLAKCIYRYPAMTTASFLVARGVCISPNLLSITALVLGILASVTLLLIPSYLGGIIAVILLTLFYITDCLDGEFARRCQKTSPLGGYLDDITDRIIEILFFGALGLRFFFLTEEALFLIAAYLLITSELFLNLNFFYTRNNNLEEKSPKKRKKEKGGKSLLSYLLNQGNYFKANAYVLLTLFAFFDVFANGFLLVTAYGVLLVLANIFFRIYHLLY